MTDKEKQAIEQLLIDKELVLNGCSTAIISIDDLETVLNLVETQQEELEKKDKMIDEMAKAILSYDDQLIINKFKDIENVNEVSRTVNQIAKAVKQINNKINNK